MGLRIVRASAKTLTQFSVGAPTAASEKKLLEQQGDRTRRKTLLRRCGRLAGSRVLLRRLRRWWGRGVPHAVRGFGTRAGVGQATSGSAVPLTGCSSGRSHRHQAKITGCGDAHAA
ncbi:hypothetical protein [Microcoleus sp. M2_C2]|uniref:hypothetical protein n=1 Tax=Microcoleus sp. M2_C2 TaxID=3055369 RepID=UPI002FD27F75